MKQISLLILLLVLNASAGICQADNKIIEAEVYKPTESEKAREYYNKASDAVDAKNFTRAITYYKMALAEDPGFIDAYDNLGLAYRQINELDSAEHYYLISNKKFPKGAVALRNLAVVEEKRKNYDKAIEYYKRAQVINDTDPEVYYGMMRMNLMKEDFKEALKNGNKAEKYYKEQNSEYIGDCYYMLCITHMMLNNKEKAREYAKLAESKGMTINSQITDALK
jgi:tetratricopeptide (TPR) repeat protein